MIDFREVSLKDAELCRSFFKESQSPSCDYTFGNLYTWKDVFNYKIAFSEGFMFVRSGKNDFNYFLPLGNGDIAAAIEMLREQEKKAVRIYGVSAEELKLLKSRGVELKDCRLYRDASDYIYKVQDLILLSGKKYHSKRNFISRFEAKYNWTYETVSDENILQCLDICNRWFEENEPNANTENEKTVIQSTFENYNALGLRGGILKIDGKVVAFTVGEAINAAAFCIHIEKALVEYTGVYAMMNREFLARNCLDYVYVNREEDMGLEGLRKAKESYHPEFILEKYNIVI